MALSPWHIMLSRWALDCNALLFLFLCGLALLVMAVRAHRKETWLISSHVMLGASVYAYDTAYVAVPLFVFGTLCICVLYRVFTTRLVLLAGLAFGASALPMALYVFVNYFQWDFIAIGAITVPHLPVTANFVTQVAARPELHITEFVQLLVTQRDGLLWNVTDPYGVLYSGLFMVLAGAAIVGIPILVALRQWPPERLLISLWVMACIPTGILQSPNVNRVNLLFLGIVVAAGICLGIVDKWARGALIVGLLSLLVGCSFFMRDYFTAQSEKIGRAFFDGLLPALSYARQSTAPDDTICVTGRVNMPHAFTLFGDPQAPRDYLQSVQYVDPRAHYRRAASYGRYTFGLQRCDLGRARAVVVRTDENVPEPFVKAGTFSLFDVYVRR